MLRKVKVEEAIGLALAHDVTKVVPGVSKGPGFRRGHVIRQEDIPELLKLGKEHVYVLELREGELHEEEAARRISQAIGGRGIEFTEPSEGRVNLKAQVFGLLKVNKDLLRRINSIGDIVVSTLHNLTVCQPGTTVAGTRIIPLIIDETIIKRVEELCQQNGRVVEVLPFRRRKVGAIITGNEVFKGRIEDGFGPIIRRKVKQLGSVLEHKVIVPDDAEVIARAMKELICKGVEVVIICGGLSVDPDDVTAEGVRGAGARIISYGAPVLPGSMFLYAVYQGVPILGAPACVLYNPTTILDLILPRVLAGDQVSREDIIDLGHGGLCLGCRRCSFPVCPFGK